MERAQKHNSVNMIDWQSAANAKDNLTNFARTEAELHTCGNTACFAGHLAVSPEWLETKGFHSSETGCPIYDGNDEYMVAEDAISEWLGIDSVLACEFIRSNGMGDDYHMLYKTQWRNVKAEHVIRELTLLMKIGEDAYCALYGI